MLAATARLRHAREFDSVVRGGRRSGRSSLVVHVRPAPDRIVTRAGFVVSKAVGGSVVRNRVKRRLRELVRSRTAGIVGYDLVVRALPAAAGTTFAGLRRDLDAALTRLGFPDQNPGSGNGEPAGEHDGRRIDASHV